MLALGVLLLQACSADSIEQPAESEGMEFNMVLRIPLGTTAQTRADYNTEYTDGQGNPADGENEGLDYTLVENDLRIMLYSTTDGSFVEEVVPSGVQRQTDRETFVDYYLRGRLAKILANDTKQYRVVVLANLKGQLSAGSYSIYRGTESSLYADMSFNYEGANVAHSFTQNNWEAAEPGSTAPLSGRVPMWGKTTVRMNSADPVRITMLRSLAKVRVKLSDQLKSQGYTITGIELHNPSNKGYVAPKGAATATKTSDCTALTAPVNIPSSATYLAAPQYFYEGKYANAGNWYTYLPETKNTSVTDEHHPYMNVQFTRTLAGGEIKPFHYRLEFGDYEPVSQGGTDYRGTLFDIQRNHYYQYVIVGLDDHDAKLKYEVCDWNRYSTEIFFN